MGQPVTLNELVLTTTAVLASLPAGLQDAKVYLTFERTQLEHYELGQRAAGEILALRPPPRATSPKDDYGVEWVDRVLEALSRETSRRHSRLRPKGLKAHCYRTWQTHLVKHIAGEPPPLIVFDDLVHAQVAFKLLRMEGWDARLLAAGGQDVSTAVDRGLRIVRVLDGKEVA